MKAITEIYWLKQESTVHEYTTSFLALLASAQISEDNAINFFIGGLQREIRDNVLSLSPKTLSSAICGAKLHEGWRKQESNENECEVQENISYESKIAEDKPERIEPKEFKTLDNTETEISEVATVVHQFNDVTTEEENGIIEQTDFKIPNLEELDEIKEESGEICCAELHERRLQQEDSNKKDEDKGKHDLPVQENNPRNKIIEGNHARIQPEEFQTLNNAEPERFEEEFGKSLNLTVAAAVMDEVDFTASYLNEFSHPDGFTMEELKQNDEFVTVVNDTQVANTDSKAPYDEEDFAANLNGKNLTNDVNANEEANPKDNGVDMKSGTPDPLLRVNGFRHRYANLHFHHRQFLSAHLLLQLRPNHILLNNTYPSFSVCKTTLQTSSLLAAQTFDFGASKSSALGPKFFSTLYNPLVTAKRGQFIGAEHGFDSTGQFIDGDGYGFQICYSLAYPVFSLFLWTSIRVFPSLLQEYSITPTLIQSHLHFHEVASSHPTITYMNLWLCIKDYNTLSLPSSGRTLANSCFNNDAERRLLINREQLSSMITVGSKVQRLKSEGSSRQVIGLCVVIAIQLCSINSKKCIAFRLYVFYGFNGDELICSLGTLLCLSCDLTLFGHCDCSWVQLDSSNIQGACTWLFSIQTKEQVHVARNDPLCNWL